MAITMIANIDTNGCVIESNANIDLRIVNLVTLKTIMTKTMIVTIMISNCKHSDERAQVSVPIAA